MESFVFNEFKKNFIEGNIKKTDTWKAYPVIKEFADDYGDKLQYIKHHNDLPLFVEEKIDPIKGSNQYFNYYMSKMNKTTYRYKAMYDIDEPVEPIYVSEDNFDYFLEKYPDQGHLRSLFFTENGIKGRFYRPSTKTKTVVESETTIDEYVPRGFYYVLLAEELLWCANKVNGNQYDNTINIVLGDNIGVMYEKNDNLSKDQLKKINFSIGSNPSQPYEGIFFGNGFSISNIELVCNSDVCGIVGYLGHHGKISTININGYNLITCDKKINISHLIKSGTDVVAGLLCGKNNGAIENVLVLGKIVVNNFIPSIYSVNNKTETKDDYDTETYTNYPDYYCFDSPGNIVPYIGYFNEGMFATYSGYNPDNGKFQDYWSTLTTYDSTHKNDSQNIIYSPMEWYYWEGLPLIDGGSYFMHFTHEKNRLNVLWYDGNIINQTNVAAGKSMGQINDFGLFRFNSGDDSGQSCRVMKYVNYFNKSIKLSQQNRAAYYVSPLIGMNNNIVEAVTVNADVITSGTFVGFIGGIAGKQANGTISNVTTNIKAYDAVKEKTANTTNETVYLRDYYTANQAGKNLYCFYQKSIKNISSLFGSCVVGNINSLCLNNVNSYLQNYHNIIFKNNDLSEPEHDDYYFLNRFAPLAAIVEYNTTNISDLWASQTEANDPNNRSIVANNCKFGYFEGKDNNIIDKSVEKASPYTITGEERFSPGNRNNMYGVASTLFAEVKPTYLSVPSIIPTFFKNKGYYIGNENNNKDYSYYHVGLFGIDQNIAAPITDPYFQCIDLEVDLPGVANRRKSIDDYGVAGGVVDRLNNIYTNNFALDICYIPSKLVNWFTPSYIINNYSMAAHPFTTVKVPGAAQISHAHYTTAIDEDGKATAEVLEIDGINVPPQGAIAVSKEGTIYSYNGNKTDHTYSFFGSDIVMDIRLLDKPTNTDLYTVKKSNYISFTLEDAINKDLLGHGFRSNRVHINGGSRYGVTLGVTTIDVILSTEILKYQPYTDVPLPNDLVEKYYNFSAHIVGGNKNGQTVTPEKRDGKILHKLSEAFPGCEADISEYLGVDNASGFAFYIDYSEPGGKDQFLYYVIPYCMESYDLEKENPNPPYQRFEGFYIQTEANESHDLPCDYCNFAGTRDKLNIDTSKWDGNIPKVHDYLIVKNENPKFTEINPKYYLGRNSDGTDKWSAPGEKPTLTTAYVTAFKWKRDPNDNNTFKFIKAGSLYELTTNPAEAVSGYVSSARITTAAGLEPFFYSYVNGIVTGTDGKYYRCYGNDNFTNYNDIILDTIPTGVFGNGIFTQSAVPLENIPSADWNWQDDIVVGAMLHPDDSAVFYNGYISQSDQEDRPYQYDTPSLNYNLQLTQDDVADIELEDLKPPKSWMELNCTGSFRNYLLNGTDVRENNLQSSMDTSIFNKYNSISNNNPLSSYYNMYVYGESIKNNILKSINVNSDSQQTYFKYTYDKSVPVPMTFPLYIPVNFNYTSFNDGNQVVSKAGFWFQANPNGLTNAECEYGENGLVYGQNVFAIGKTLSEDALLNRCLCSGTRTWDVSGFSANDFEGLLIEDSDSRPVMYIDVGLGECTEGTSWSLSSFPSKNINNPKAANTCSGLLLEID